MPYTITKEDGKFVVRKRSDNTPVGTHDSHNKAKAQIAAIMMSEAENKK